MGAVGTVLNGFSPILDIRASPPGAAGSQAPNPPQLTDVIFSLIPLFFGAQMSPREKWLRGDSSPGDQLLWLPQLVLGWVLGASQVLGASSQLVLTEAFAKWTPNRWGRARGPPWGWRAVASIAALIAAVLS